MAAPLAENDYHHDRRSETELAVVEAHGDDAVVRRNWAAKITATSRRSLRGDVMF